MIFEAPDFPKTFTVGMVVGKGIGLQQCRLVTRTFEVAQGRSYIAIGME